MLLSKTSTAIADDMMQDQTTEPIYGNKRPLWKTALYWITRPIARPMMYPGSIQTAMKSFEPLRRNGRELLHLIGGEVQATSSRDGYTIDGMLIRADEYRARWHEVRQRRADLLRRLGLLPSGETLCQALRMPMMTGRVVKGGATTLFAPGNGLFYETCLPEIAMHLDRGMDVRLFNYPGYGLSGGSPNEESTYEAAALAFESIKSERILLHGLSLGGGVSGYIFKRYKDIHPNLHLILDRTFCNMRTIASETLGLPLISPVAGFVASLVYKYPTDENIRGEKDRVIIVRALDDELIAGEHQDRLHAALADGARAILDVPGGHNATGSGLSDWYYHDISQEKLTTILRQQGYLRV